MGIRIKPYPYNPPFGELYVRRELLNHDDPGLWAFQRTASRKTPYRLITPVDALEPRAMYGSIQRKRPFKEWATPSWLPECAAMTQQQALTLIERWQLVPCPIPPHNAAAFALIKAEADRVGWPTSYATDLDIDKQMLNMPGATRNFIWVLRNMGTHIVKLDRINDTEGNQAPVLIEAIGRLGGGESHRFYHSVDGSLKPITYDRALYLADDALQRHRSKEHERLKSA